MFKQALKCFIADEAESMRSGVSARQGVRPHISHDLQRPPGSGLESCIQLPGSFAMQAWAPTAATLAVA